MSESALLRGSRGPVFALHHTEIRGRCAECDAVTLTVRASPAKRAAARDAALEVINVRGFERRAGRLIVAAVFVEPRNRVGINTPVGSHRRLILRCATR